MQISKRKLLVMPDDGIQPLLSAIGEARTSIEIQMFLFSEPRLVNADLHAKMMLADDKRAIVGSMNIAPGSFDERRELAIEVDNEHIIKRLRRIFERDWKNSDHMDLTDEGLLKDLEQHGRSDGGSLALYDNTGRKGH